MPALLGSRRRQVVAASLLASAATSSQADPTDTFCRQVEINIQALVDWTGTKCVATGGKSAGRNSFLLIAEKPVFANAQSKKGWLLVTCAAAGMQLQKQSGLKVDELWLSDVEHTKQHIAYIVPAATCKRLHLEIKADKITADQMYASLSSALTERQTSK